MNRELLKMKKALIKSNTPSKEDAMAEALSDLIARARNGLIERDCLITEFSKII